VVATGQRVVSASLVRSSRKRYPALPKGLTMRKPGFFIVGAPRCGTTAMYEYLRLHPQVFMPEHKEPNFFGDDLNHRHGRLTEADYLRLFRDAAPGQRVGEASTWYLYSRTAAREIRQFTAKARIIVMLRNPVDVMHSLHREMVFYRAEDIDDFASALEAEPDRKLGRRIPRGVRRIETLLYREVVQFADQLERYLATFPSDQVKVLLFDDLRADASSVYAETLRFLDVDLSFVPRLEPANESKHPRFRPLQDLVVHPPAPFRDLIPHLRRYPIAHRVRSAILAVNSRKATRAPMDPELRRQLTAELAPEVHRLGELIGRDLRHWTATATSSVA
jgi:Sulfotransferase domain